MPRTLVLVAVAALVAVPLARAARTVVAALAGEPGAPSLQGFTDVALGAVAVIVGIAIVALVGDRREQRPAR